MLFRVNTFREFTSKKAGKPVGVSFSEEVVDICLAAMACGELHVDCVNDLGNTLGLVMIPRSPLTMLERWRTYWALGPSVDLFWSSCTCSCKVCISDPWRHVIVDTEELWKSCGESPVWAQEARAALRWSHARATWIAAVVVTFSCTGRFS